MTKNDVRLFFKFTTWGWIAILIYIGLCAFSIGQYKLCMHFRPDAIILWKVVCAIELMISTYAEVVNMPRVFMNYRRRRTQYDKLCALYRQYGKLPESVVYSMKTTNCEKIVVKQFLKDTGATL